MIVEVVVDVTADSWAMAEAMVVVWAPLPIVVDGVATRGMVDGRLLFGGS